VTDQIRRWSMRSSRACRWCLVGIAASVVIIAFGLGATRGLHAWAVHEVELDAREYAGRQDKSGRLSDRPHLDRAGFIEKLSDAAAGVPSLGLLGVAVFFCIWLAAGVPQESYIVVVNRPFGEKYPVN